MKNNKLLNLCIKRTLNLFIIFCLISVQTNVFSQKVKIKNGKKISKKNVEENQVIRATSFINKKGKTKIRAEWSNLEVSGDEIKDEAITEDKIGTGEVTSNHIQNGTITRTDLSGNMTGLQSATLVVAQDGTGDYNNIQNAIDNLSSGKGKIIIKEGIYTITASIRPVDNLIIEGLSTATTIQASNSMDTMIGMINNKNITIKNISLDGNSNSVSLIVANNSSQITIENCYLTGSNSQFNYVIGLDGTGTSVTTGFRVINNQIENVHAQSILIAINEASDCLVKGNIGNVNLSLNGGIFLTDCYSSIITENIIIDAATGCGITSSTFCEISNNVFRDGIFSGISLSTSHDNIISNNNVLGNGFDGVTLVSSDRNTVIGNNCQNNTGSGVNVNDTNSDNNFIATNFLINNASAISDSGTGTLSTGNKTS